MQIDVSLADSLISREQQSSPFEKHEHLLTALYSLKTGSLTIFACQSFNSSSK